MQTLPPIPIPASERWREFRLRTLPLLAFLGAAVVVTYLWQMSVLPPTVIGQVEQTTSLLISPTTGCLTEVHVKRFQTVKKGDLLALLTPTDPKSALDYMHAQLENFRARLDPDLAERGFDIKLQRLRLPWLQEKVNLATAESNLEFAKTEFLRSESLFKQNAMTAQAYQLILQRKQALETGIIEQKKLVADLEGEIQKLKVPQQTTSDGRSLEEVLKDQEQTLVKLVTSLEPIKIVAPFDGMISTLSYQAGENVASGGTIATLTGLHAESIVGFMHEPLSVEPEVGMEVLVRTRHYHPESCTSKIIAVGAQYETIVNPLMRYNPAIVEAGLPIQIDLPASMHLRPGSLVELTLRPKQVR